MSREELGDFTSDKWVLMYPFMTAISMTSYEVVKSCKAERCTGKMTPWPGGPLALIHIYYKKL